MTMKDAIRVLYNEIDRHCCDWLSNLMDAGLITPGRIDDRSISDLIPDDLAGFGRTHLFAGIGVWDHALRLAGWPDDRPVWTGSCPCQPFSTAGRGGGFADERHLWPHWHHLIEICRPPVVFGEQTASKGGLAWFDLVQADLEGTGYACGAVDLCAAGVGAPHIRQRLWFVGDSGGAGLARPSRQPRRLCAVGGLGNAERISAGWNTGAGIEEEAWSSMWSERDDTRQPSAACPLADADRRECYGLSGSQGCECDGAQAGWQQGDREPECGSATSGFWRGADWIPCRDGKTRPVKSGTFPLVDGSAFRMDSGSSFAGKSRAQILKGIGNAIVPQVAAEVIMAFMEACP
jgi:DNA (cytosine-5)-methyltransferase 1